MKARWYAAEGVKREKITGEVFTPQGIGHEMLDLVLGRDPSLISGNYLDPSCGDGNLLVYVLERKLLAGLHPYQALESLYGIELIEENVQRCRERLIACAAKELPDDALDDCKRIIDEPIAGSRYSRIVCHDTLTWDVNKWRPINETVFTFG